MRPLVLKKAPFDVSILNDKRKYIDILSNDAVYFGTEVLKDIVASILWILHQVRGSRLLQNGGTKRELLSLNIFNL
jgi:hypothetical protein